MTNAELTASESDMLAPPATSSAQFGTLQLDAHARSLATALKIVQLVPDRSRTFRQRFDRDVETIQRAYDLAVDATKTRDVALPVCDWLLDNFYVIREQIRDIKEHLPVSFFRELPKLSDGRPRVHELARELVAHCDAALDEEMMIRFVDQFQIDAELTIGESWAFPVMLRLALVEQLQAICSQLIEELQATEDVQRIIEDWDSSGRFLLTQHSITQCAPTLLVLYSALRARGRDYAPAIAALDRYVQSMGWQLPELQRLEQRRLAANQVSMGNIITSMRLLAAVDWIVFFERTNRCDRILRNDPAGVYAAMDFASRNRYRSAIEQLSKRTAAIETEVANHALMFATTEESEAKDATNAGATARSDTSQLELRRHIGYWLVDEGRADVERAIGYQPSWMEDLLRKLRAHAFSFYIGSILLWMGVICGLLLVAAIERGIPANLILLMVLLLLLPASEAAVLLTNAVATRLLPPRLLPKLELLEGIPVQHPTIVVIPSLLGSQREAHALLARLENHYLTNMDPQLSFALLTDFPDAPTETVPTDEAILASAVAGIRSLNEKYGGSEQGPFFLFHRQRLWNQSEKTWMGWERKRGKLMEFGRVLAGASDTSYGVQVGHLERLAAFRRAECRPFVITLDADTVLPRGVARRLIGAMAHPLNRPITAADGSCIERGYSILQPRIGINIGDSLRTRYLQTQAMNPGIDPYVSATSDVYQDWFGEGSFTGKGIYDLRAFEQMLESAFPENQILSHDLIEGCHARVALVSDIEVFDSHPARYDADARRVHRWVRGDWQISPWLLPRVPHATGRIRNKLSALSRWKIFDNLRRSLVAPGLLLFLLIGWLAIPQQALVWSLMATLLLSTPLGIQAVFAATSWTRRHSWRDQVKHHLYGLAKTAEQLFYAACFLPHKAWQMADAILRTIFRMTITRRRLLEWETAAAVDSRLANRRGALFLQLAICSLVGLSTALLLDPIALPAAAPWLLSWIAAPLLGHFISQPQRRRDATGKSVDQDWLRHVASSTWAFFERYVNESGNWLPPDNVQEYPREKVATRISPTNQGFFLVSGLVAQRLGLIGVSPLLELWEENLRSWLSLQQLHGHHFNWYETSKLATLQPRYVSTVDSGNLAACYLTMSQGIAELGELPLADQRLIDGARTSLRWLKHYSQAALEEKSKDVPRQSQIEQEASRALTATVARAEELLPRDLDSFAQILRLNDVLRETISHLATGIDKLALVPGAENLAAQSRILAARLGGICRDIAELMPWLGTAVSLESNAVYDLAWVFKTLTPQIPLRSLAQLSTLLEPQFERHLRNPPTESSSERFDLLQKLREEVQKSTEVAQDRLQRLSAIVQRCEAAALKMDFRFLYSKRRKLFSIGFNADEGRLDRSHYDLLCSECRIASYLAIAKGDVETEHWFRLGRPAAEFHGRHVLLSWGGTMFEYLMPPLFQKSYEGTLLDTSCEIAIARQQDYARQRNIPWGISESAFSAMSANSDYQYKSFGVPGLGLKRGLSKELVVSPYSVGMALPFVPQEATENLKRLAQLAMGDWGFYDALDYTPSRLRRKENVNVVRNYMAHHQGMTMLGIANTIGDSMIQRWFHSYPLVRANELLLQERVPAYIDSEVPNPDEVDAEHVAREETTLLARRITGTHSSTPRTQLLSNEHFSTMLTHAGGGYCCTDSLQLTRWRSDPTRDQWGSFIYLRNRSTGNVWSATYQPTRTVPDHYEAIFSVDKAEIHRRQSDIETTLEVAVSPEHPAEVRQLRITNHSAHEQSIEVTSYLEVSLSSQAADVAHPAFQKLFVETEYVAEDATLIARRRPRDASQAPQYMLHTISTPGHSQTTIQYETDREKFIGRGRDLEFPVALESDRLSGTVGAVLDPILSLRCTVTIAPSESVVVAFTTAAAHSREQALSLADLFHDMRGVHRAFELAWAYTQIELRHLNLTAKQAHVFQQLAGNVLYPDSAMRGDAAKIAKNRLGQSSLWNFGISGDLPIILLRVTESNQLDLVQELVSAHS
ncbi:MAG: glucoamylase family protein, partial [Aureliella sp.]